MSVNSVLTDLTNNTTKVNAETSKAKVGNSNMDQNVFLQLLMAQLKNQDPLNPMSNTEFVSQQAQFTQISELQQLNQGNSFVQASSLIGKQVTFNDPNNVNKQITGTVSEAKISSSGTSIVVNDTSYPASVIKSIK